MTRAQRFALLSALVVSVYLLLTFSIVSIPFVSSEVSGKILPVLPWWLLVSFGAYSLATLGWGLWSFRDCPEAYEELMLEINQAKNDLRAKGVTVD